MVGSTSNNPHRNECDDDDDDDDDDDVAKLLSMGFDRALAIQALADCGSLEGAIHSLASGSVQGKVKDNAAGAKQKQPTTDFLDRDNIEWDDHAAADDPPLTLKLADSNDNNVDKVSPPTTTSSSSMFMWLENNYLDAHDASKSKSTVDAHAQSQPSPLPMVGAHVEQIDDDDIGPNSWPALNHQHDSDEKKSTALSARMELINDISESEPEPPMFTMERAFLYENPKKSSALVGGGGKGTGLDSSNFETTDSFISFDSLEGQNYHPYNTNNNIGRWDDEPLQSNADTPIFPKNSSAPTARSVAVVNDEEQNDSNSSKSDSDQEEYIAVIPEAFLVEEDTEGEIIQATLIEPSTPWWKMRPAQQIIFCFVILLVVPLSIFLGIFLRSKNNNGIQEGGDGAVPPALSLAPSDANGVIGDKVPASVANAPSQPSPSAAPTCFLDSNCGATLEIWKNIVGPTTSELRLYTNNLSNEPNEKKRLWSLLEAPSNIGDNYGSRMKGWLMPPVTGNYTFWIASDDWSELWLSADDDPANLELACYAFNWVASRDWNVYDDQKSPPISLVAGQTYYYQALMKEGDGLDNLAIAWKYPGQELQVIPAEYSLMAGPYIDNEIILVDTLAPSMSPEQSVNCSTDSHCGAILETWTGIEGVSAVNLVLESNFFEDAPDKTERLWNLLEVPSNTDENYGDVMEGWLVPPVTGDYTFWIASDDNGEFFFNPNYGIGYVDNASGRICYTPEYSGGREWDKDLKQKSQPIGLVKGQPYFFQIRRKQGTNENHLAIAWQYPGQTREVIPAMYSRTTSLEFTCLDCGATWETWMDIEGWSVDDLRLGSNNFLNMPSSTERLWTLLEGPSNIGDNYGSRMKGWLVPPVTGNYTFWIASDDQGEFWLSTDEDRENMVRACRVPISVAKKREWTWFRQQESPPISLVAGKAYYFEALMKEGGGEDHLAIAWRYPGQELQVIPAKYSRITNPSTCLDSNCGANLKTWTGIAGKTVYDLIIGTNDFENTPNNTDRLRSLLEIVQDQGENYGIRMTGWLVPPVSGIYLFWIASDDASELWLSTDDDPATRDLVCNCTSSVGYRDYNGEQRSAQIQFVAGQAYYFEAVMKEGRGADHFSIAWEYPGQYREVIPAFFSRTTRTITNNGLG